MFVAGESALNSPWNWTTWISYACKPKSMRRQQSEERHKAAKSNKACFGARNDLPAVFDAKPASQFILSLVHDHTGGAKTGRHQQLIMVLRDGRQCISIFRREYQSIKWNLL